MDHNETYAAVEVMKAFCEGYAIERYTQGDNGRWFEDENPTWNWERYQYRVKRS